MQLCQRRGEVSELRQSTWHRSCLFGHLQMTGVEVGMYIGEQWIIKLERLFQRALEKVLTLCQGGWTVDVGYSFCAEESCDLWVHVDHVRIVKSSDSVGLCIVLVGEIT